MIISLFLNLKLLNQVRLEANVRRSERSPEKMAESLRGGEWVVAAGFASLLCETCFPMGGFGLCRRRNLAHCPQKLHRRSQSKNRHKHSCFNCSDRDCRDEGLFGSNHHCLPLHNC